MKIGLLSDIHEDILRTEESLKILKEKMRIRLYALGILSVLLRLIIPI